MLAQESRIDTSSSQRMGTKLARRQDGAEPRTKHSQSQPRVPSCWRHLPKLVTLLIGQGDCPRR